MQITMRKINLRPLGMEIGTERGNRFWNSNLVEMKLSVEWEWIRMTHFAEEKPDYGIQTLFQKS